MGTARCSDLPFCRQDAAGAARGWRRLVAAVAILAGTSGTIGIAFSHPLSLQECFEGGDFIAHAAQARDNGMTKVAFLDRLVSDIRLIQAYPPELRWFVADPEDAEFLYGEAARVFDDRQAPETHRASFLARCFERMARLD